MGLIRTKTFIKYARINLQEAEAALSASDYEVCARKVISCTDALIKAVAEALPMVKADFFKMKRERFASNLEDLTDDAGTSSRITEALFEARRLAMGDETGRSHVERALGHAGAAFTAIHALFT